MRQQSFRPDTRFTDYQRVLDAQEQSDGTMRLTLKFPTLRYLDELVGLTCAPDLLALNLFPNAKEITESFACFRAVRSVLGIDPRDEGWMIAVIGDGSTPRTAATFTFRSKWLCISVDPQLANLNADRLSALGAVRGLVLMARRIEEIEPGTYERLVIVAPHSHASLQTALKKFRARVRHVVALPCCLEQQVVDGRPPDVRYDDWGCWSPHRSVLVWRNV